MSGKIAVGIGIGASRVKIVSLSDNPAYKHSDIRDHYGDPRGTLEKMLSAIDSSSVGAVAVTGREGSTLIKAKKVLESEAVEEALHITGSDADLVVSLGGESFVVYPIGPDGTVLDHICGNRCAAGTVEFFKQQLGRMGLTIEKAAELAENGTVVPLAKRCSVHCKSDCTHALNKKKCTVADIVVTLCHNMAEKVATLVQGTSIKSGRLIAIGGATANPIIVDFLGKFLPEFTIIVPAEAQYFEALGAASLARQQKLSSPIKWPEIFMKSSGSFAVLPPLANYVDDVTFLPSRRESIVASRKYILGVDGGSTTTKVALVDVEKRAICGAYYTKTNGNPEMALKKCLTNLEAQVNAAIGKEKLEIVGVATTGSSGELLSVLCSTEWNHNEIIAHVYGASHYCPNVDTILEIGGQDSKFTLLNQKVAVDFNMNESCSAGTGSFIEETAREDLGVPLDKVSDLAMQSQRPLQFSNQCAAFANSDTRKALQEGASKEDNLAGLIYAIVENYLSKVVGQRCLGNNILFQGGTSKNKAIAYAFAAKTAKHITVPPDSELIGCFGIALWYAEKLASGEAEAESYTIAELLAAVVEESKDFQCKACENFCTVHNLIISGKSYPFGGRCSRWENVRKHKPTDNGGLDLVSLRNRMMFHEYGVSPHTGLNGDRPHIGMLGVFSTYSLYPLYSWFFHELGFAIDLSENVDPQGVQKCQSARCYPYEIAHGTFQDLLTRGVTNIFVPHVVSMPYEEDQELSVACPIAQAVPYCISSAFEMKGIKILDPVIDLSRGLESAEETLVKLALSIGRSAEHARSAFRKGCERQNAFISAIKAEGARILEKIGKENKVAVVLVGRPYNAFSKITNMGIPRKFASSGVMVIPCEFLPYEGESCDKTMYWTYGQTILKSLSFVKNNPNLFPVYISNFGCGPDSFILHFAEKILGCKPCLYLELDSHTADAGVATRAAAFIDIVSGYRKSGAREKKKDFVASELVSVGSRSCVRTSAGEVVELSDPRVTLVFPSMGLLNTQVLAASTRRFGFNAIALPPADEGVLSIGKEFTSGKECVPAVLTIGSLINYWRGSFKQKRKDEILLFFMPTADGPCRFGQYNVYIKMLINSLEMEDVAVFSLTCEDGYNGLGLPFVMSAWMSIVIGSMMSDIRAMLDVAAKNREEAITVFNEEWQKLLSAVSQSYAAIYRALKATSRRLATIPLRLSPSKVPKVLLAGEIYVRNDALCCQGIGDYYAEAGLMLKCADVLEWVYYSDWIYLYKLARNSSRTANFLSAGFFLNELRKSIFLRQKPSKMFVVSRIKLALEQIVDKKLRKILAKSGLLSPAYHDINDVIRRGEKFVNLALEGEAVLSAGSACQMMEHAPQENYCGVVFIGPFNCMPTGVAESVMKPYARKKGIPYLTFETDAGPMPSNLKSQMEVHVLRSRRYAKARGNSGGSVELEDLS